MENIRQKIEKLLRLANNEGATEHEAARAMEMASALMLKYNISVSLGETDEDVSVDRGSPLTYPDPWQVFLASAAAYLYNCKIIRLPQYGVQFVGRAHNRDAAEQTFLFLLDQVEAFYKIALPRGLSKPARADFRRSFKLACASRVYHRAEEIMQQFRNNDAKALEYTGSKALVVVQSIDQQLKECEAFMETLNLRDSRAVSYKTGTGTLAGRKAGDQVKLNHQVDS